MVSPRFASLRGLGQVFPPFSVLVVVKRVALLQYRYVVWVDHPTFASISFHSPAVLGEVEIAVDPYAPGCVKETCGW